MRRIVSVAIAGDRPRFLEGGSHGYSRDDVPPGIRIRDYWNTATPPQPLFAGVDAGRAMPLLPEPGGTCFRLLEVDPGSGMPLHATDTVDYLVILRGQIRLRLDGGAEIELVPGDAVVQLGAAHAWENRGTETCVMVAVVVSTRASLVSDPHDSGTSP